MDHRISSANVCSAMDANTSSMVLASFMEGGICIWISSSSSSSEEEDSMAFTDVRGADDCDDEDDEFCRR